MKRLKTIKHFLKNLFQVFYISILDFDKNNGIEHAGNLAFLSMLSFFPFIIFFTFILGLIGQTAAGTEFINLVLTSIPPDIENIARPIIQEITKNLSFGVLSLVFIGIIWSGSSLVEGARTILNRTYRVAHQPPYILGRILSILEFFAITFVIVSTIFGLIIIPQMIQRMNVDFIKDNYNHLILYTRTGSFITYVVLFKMTSLLYYLTPNKKQKFEFVFPGALITTTGWVIAGKLFSFYIKTFDDFSIIYGSLGGVIIALVFFYIISIIFIYGAEFNYHFGEKFLNKFLRRIKIFN
jgi:membrane protein